MGKLPEFTGPDQTPAKIDIAAEVAKIANEPRVLTTTVVLHPQKIEAYARRLGMTVDQYKHAHNIIESPPLPES